MKLIEGVFIFGLVFVGLPLVGLVIAIVESIGRVI